MLREMDLWNAHGGTSSPHNTTQRKTAAPDAETPTFTVMLASELSGKVALTGGKLPHYGFRATKNRYSPLVTMQCSVHWMRCICVDRSVATTRTPFSPCLFARLLSLVRCSDSGRGG